MRRIDSEEIVEAVSRLSCEANYYLNEDILRAIEKGIAEEESPVGREILQQIRENARIAAANKMPICQDTGVAVVFVEIGNQISIKGDLEQAINKGISKGYKEGYLRKSIVDNPIFRNNTGDNTPAVIYTEMVKGDNLKIIVAPKGGGSENMSRINMLKPADGRDGIIDFVCNTVSEAGANPCPPLVVGVGIGGTFEKAALLSKKALLRKLDDRHPDPQMARLEEELLSEINKLGIGPQGLGGTTTALGVNIEVFPCHIASLPVAVNLNCHVSRHRQIVL